MKYSQILCNHFTKGYQLHILRGYYYVALMFLCSAISFAQKKDSIIFYVNPHTTLSGAEKITIKTTAKKDQEKTTIYIVENTIVVGLEGSANIVVYLPPIIESPKEKIAKQTREKKTKIITAPCKYNIEKETPNPFRFPLDTNLQIVSIAISSPSPNTHQNNNHYFILSDNTYYLYTELLSQQIHIVYLSHKHRHSLEQTHHNKPPPVSFC